MSNNLLAKLSVQQLKRALEIKQQIDALGKELDQILSSPAKATVVAVARSAKPAMSAAVRAKIAATQKARWDIINKAKTPQKPAAKGKRRLSPEGRARIIAATKARWAKFWAEKKGSTGR